MLGNSYILNETVQTAHLYIIHLHNG